MTGRAAAGSGIFAPPRPENNPCSCIILQIIELNISRTGVGREEFAISRAEVELCITGGPETSFDEDKLLIQTESSKSCTKAEHHGKIHIEYIVDLLFI